MIAKTLTSNVIQTTGVCLNFDANDETWTIATGVIVFSGDSAGVSNHAFANSSLVNHGKVIAPGLDQNAVIFDLGNGHVANTAGAEIYGQYNGISFEGAGNASAVNFGSIIGFFNAGIGFYSDTVGVALNNRGSIFGKAYGVFQNSDHTGGTINNFKAIRSDEVGIQIEVHTGLMADVTNAAGALIKGAYSLYCSSGDLVLTNHGTMVGTIRTNEHSVIVNDGVIKGPLYLSNVNDTYNGNGGTSGAIFGNGGNDHLGGGPQADHIEGSDGNDFLTGRLGADRFFFNSPLNAATNVDNISDFTPAQHDKIVLDDSYFPNLGPLGTLGAGHFHSGAPVNGNAQIVYTPGNGFLYYDANGNALGGATHFATLTTHPVIHNTDFLVIA